MKNEYAPMAKKLAWMKKHGYKKGRAVKAAEAKKIVQLMKKDGLLHKGTLWIDCGFIGRFTGQKYFYY